MPSPERPSSRTPYLRVARFPGERPAGRAYFQIQDLLLRAPACDLSVYRLQLARTWHVAVLGLPPHELLERRINRVLAGGIPSVLPEDVLQELRRRRQAATGISPWVEHHVTPPSE